MTKWAKSYGEVMNIYKLFHDTLQSLGCVCGAFEFDPQLHSSAKAFYEASEAHIKKDIEQRQPQIYPKRLRYAPDDPDGGYLGYYTTSSRLAVAILEEEDKITWTYQSGTLDYSEYAVIEASARSGVRLVDWLPWHVEGIEADELERKQEVWFDSVEMLGGRMLRSRHRAFLPHLPMRPGAVTIDKEKILKDWGWDYNHGRVGAIFDFTPLVVLPEVVEQAFDKKLSALLESNIEYRASEVSVSISSTYAYIMKVLTSDEENFSWQAEIPEKPCLGGHYFLRTIRSLRALVQRWEELHNLRPDDVTNGGVDINQVKFLLDRLTYVENTRFNGASIQQVREVVFT